MFHARFIENLKQKLSNNNTGSVYLDAFPEHYLGRLSLGELKQLQAQLPQQFIETLLKEAQFSFTLSPKQQVQPQSQRILRKLDQLTLHNNDHFEEHGTSPFGFGFPVLLFKNPQDPERVIKAPLLIWYLDIERNLQQRHTWVIRRKTEAPIINNPVLRIFLRAQANVQLESMEQDFLDDDVISPAELLQLVQQQLQQLSPSLPLEDIQQLPIQLQRLLEGKPVAPLQQSELDKFSLEEPKILWSGVFSLFKTQKESILSDLEQLQTQLNSFKNNSTNPSTLNLEHAFTTVATDPSQQHLLHLLKQGKNLVIQGPPGTGKSQTLTGIIGNVLANGGTCLVVCEKKTAMEVLFDNLKAQGLGQLAVIVEDIYRDRKLVVDSVRYRIQQLEQPSRSNTALYEHSLEQCRQLVDRLQGFHQAQLEPILGAATWTAAIEQYLELAAQVDPNQIPKLSKTAFSFTPDELDHILPILAPAKASLQTFNHLVHPLQALGDHFFHHHSSAGAKLQLQDSLAAALRSTQRTQRHLQDYLQTYPVELAAHHLHIAQQQHQICRQLYQELQLNWQKAIQAHLQQVHQIQQQVKQGIQAYEQALETHFETVYTKKMQAIDQANDGVKTILYQAFDQALHTIKIAQEDIMACLYAYEQDLEQHFEAVYMQKMDWVDQMMAQIQEGMKASGFYFNKNKGLVRAMLRGLGKKYQALEQQKTAVLMQFQKLVALHQKHAYFKFNFISTTKAGSFTFEALLLHLEAYQTAAHTWHLDQLERIQKEVRKLSSQYSLKAVPYKKEAQSINQGLSKFRKRLLNNPLIPITFKYKDLNLRNRFDQLEALVEELEQLKAKCVAEVEENEANWNYRGYDMLEASSNTIKQQDLKAAFEQLEQTHEQYEYFEHEFMHLGRPKVIEDYYPILKHLSSYRTAVETWYTSSPATIQHYQQKFEPNYLYPAIQFEDKAQQLVEAVQQFVVQYNKSQFFGRPFQLENNHFGQQYNSLQQLEQQLKTWNTEHEHWLQQNNQYWQDLAAWQTIALPALPPQSLPERLAAWKALHQQYTYFEYNFPIYPTEHHLFQRVVLDDLIQYDQALCQWLEQSPALVTHAVQELSPQQFSPHLPCSPALEELMQALEAFELQLQAAGYFQQPFRWQSWRLVLRQQQLEELEQQIQALSKEFEDFDTYYEARQFWNQLDASQRAACSSLANIQADWTLQFSYTYIHALLEHQAGRFPDATSYENAVEQLDRRQTQLKRVMAQHILAYWRQAQQTAVANFQAEQAPVRLHSLYNKRGHAGKRRNSLRKIIATDGALFRSFFPVLMVNPSSCASILPLAPNLFDVVIFDEASQLHLEDTFSALLRGSIKVVSGDSQQMPPSDHFQAQTVLAPKQASTEDPLVQASIDFLTNTESLLAYALAEGHYKESFLSIHYRSRHPYLIDFSNAAFYGNRLAPMPAETSYCPMEFYAVNGAYVNYTNPTEVEAILDYLLNLGQQAAQLPSVGIATFNLHQRNLILQRVQEHAIEDSAQANLIQRLFAQGLFVKNLENIQGDEREVILISTTFGEREDGRFVQNFGPINRAKGYRLLNVMITRAKHKVVIFTSIPTNYYEQYRSEILYHGNTGKGILYAYLAYAKAVAAKQEASRTAILQLLAEQGQHPGSYLPPTIPREQAFQQRVIACLERALPNRVLTNYQHGGFKLPIVVKDEAGNLRWAFYFDSYHQQPSEEAYEWDLFYEFHLERLGLICGRIWSKEWWQDAKAAEARLLAIFQ